SFVRSERSKTASGSGRPRLAPDIAQFDGMQHETEGIEMINDRFSLRNRSRVPSRYPDPEAEVEYLLSAEEQLLHSISAGMPLPSILNKICDTLNSDIGNIISIASLPDDDATALAAIAKNARIFGLHKFCSAPVV